MHKCEHFIDSIYYQLEQTAKYCRYLGMQLFQRLNLPINLDEFVVLDTLLGHEGICQRDLAKLILKDRPRCFCLYQWRLFLSWHSGRT